MSMVSVIALLSVIGSVVICLLVAVAVVAVIIKLVSDKKKGKSQCGGDCYGCPYSGSCHEKSK